MTKLFWMQFNTGDWLKDPKLSMCQPATRGIWADAIAVMHEDGQSGVIAGTTEQLTRLLRCDGPSLMAAVHDLRATGTALVLIRDDRITLINRRMQREAKQRESNRKRQKRYRDKPNVTEPSQQCRNPQVCNCLFDSNSDCNSEKKKEPEGKEKPEEMFALFWDAYPRKEAKQNAWKAFKKVLPDAQLMSAMIAWLKLACESEQWQDKSKIPHPATWLNQRRWEDDPPPKPAPKNPGGPAVGQRLTPAQQREANARAVYQQVLAEQGNDDEEEPES